MNFANPFEVVSDGDYRRALVNHAGHESPKNGRVIRKNYWLTNEQIKVLVSVRDSIDGAHDVWGSDVRIGTAKQLMKMAGKKPKKLRRDND